MGGTSFVANFGASSSFSHGVAGTSGGRVVVTMHARYSDFGTIIPSGISDDLVFEFNQLEALYRATNGANWTNKTNWLTGGDMSAWHGVTLPADGKGVLKIELPSNNLTGGNIPDLNLPQLTTLNLGDNKITGAIPNFNYLPAIETLTLSTNQFSGSVPLFNNCIALSRLNLAINNLTGSVPNFSNNFSGNNWLHIDLGLNKLTGSLPRLVLPNLRFFSVYGNQLTGFPDYFYLPFASTDFTFNIENNNFSGRFPPVYTFFSTVLTLQNLYMRNNKFNFGDLLNQNFLASTGIIAYAPQQKIPITYTNGVLEVNTGIPNGDNSQDYYWYKDNNATAVAITKVNWYRPAATGVYRVEVSHNSLTNFSSTGKTLILVSNNLTVSTILKSNGGRDLPADLPACLVDDFNELEKIYDATGGANWTTKTNWLTSGNIAAWHGVWAMSADECNVADLVLNSNNLDGVLPNLNFPSATRLSFAANLLRGSIPTITAPNLKILGFSSNQLSGEIPTFGFSLDEFYINNNRFIYGDMLDGTAVKSWINTPVLFYRDQAQIPITYDNCILSVNTGVVDATQTFIWFRRNADNSLTELTRGTSPQFTPSVSGTYLCHAYHFTLSRADVPSRNIVLVSNDFTLNNKVYVKPTANGSGSGDSWANAMGNVQDALNSALCGGEVWVATGTYTPSRDATGALVNDRTRTFLIPNGLKIYGGFAGTETSLAQRGIGARSVLSGDFSGNDGISGSGSTLSLTNNGENAHHVLSINTPSVSTVINGFDIIGGNANGATSSYLGVTDGNDKGGGIFINGGGANVTIDNCVFTGNAASSGGAIANISASPTIRNCFFDKNLTALHGAALFNNNGASPTITNCVVNGGRALGVGGAMYNLMNAAVTCTNTTFNDNASAAGVIYNDGSTTTLLNGIIWNSAGTTFDAFNGGSATVTHSTIQGTPVFTGTGNTNTNPNFRNSSDPNGADNIWGTSDDGLQLACSSSAFNAGTNSGAPATDVLGTARPQFTTTDRGAYEATTNFTAQTASIVVTSGCGSSTLSASVLPVLGGETYAWSGGTTPSVQSNTATSSGTYTVTVTNNSGCTATAAATAAFTIPASRLYVNAANTNLTKDGLSWATAFDNLQAALAACKASGAEIWVTRGTYKPSTDASGNGNPSDNRTKSFVISPNTLIYGGFVGTETTLSQRPTPSVIAANSSILSGDFSGNDAVTSNGADLLVSNFEENAYHVVVANNQTGTSRLDGFTIVGGNANLAGNYNNYGGGVLSLDGGVNFTLANCILSKNSGEFGGGMANVGNAASQVVNCVFEKNYTSLHGAAATNYLSTPTFSNCVFTGNYAYAVGGAVYNLLTANATFKNSTFVGNAARLTAGGTIYNDGSFPTVSNTIIWANQPADAFGTFNNGAPTISFSIVQNGDLTNNNGNADPLLANINNPKGGDNQWFTSDDGLRLACGSPAYNSGENATATATDILGASRPQFSTADRGAYESTTNLALPTATISGATTGCGTVNLTASTTPPLGVGGHAWSGGSTPSVASNSFTISGTYTVTVTSASGCSQTASVAVTIIPLPTITFTDQVVNCIAVSVTANGGDTYAWNGGSFPSTARNSFPTSGTYTVTVTNATTGCFATQSIAVTVPTAPVCTSMPLIPTPQETV